MSNVFVLEEKNLIEVEIPKKHRVGKGQKESKEQRLLRQLETPIRTLLINPPLIMKTCEFPHPFSLLTRVAVIRHHLVDDTSYSGHAASKSTQIFDKVSIDESPFEYIQQNIGGISEVLRAGIFFSFREIATYLSKNSFVIPVLIPLVTHIPHSFRLDNLKLAVIRVVDKCPFRTIRLAYEDEQTDIFSDGGEMLVRPHGR